MKFKEYLEESYKEDFEMAINKALDKSKFFTLNRNELNQDGLTIRTEYNDPKKAKAEFLKYKAALTAVKEEELTNDKLNIRVMFVKNFKGYITLYTDTI